MCGAQSPAARACSRSVASPFRQPPSLAKRASAGATSFRMKSRTRSRTRTTSGGSVKSIAIGCLLAGFSRVPPREDDQPLGDLAHRREARVLRLAAVVADVDLLHDDRNLEHPEDVVPGEARDVAPAALRVA